jgi:hypothetical protein
VKAKAATFSGAKKTKVLEELDRHVEKASLVQFAAQYVRMSEIDSLLSTNSAKSSSSKKVKKSDLQNMLPTPTPDQLRQQAQMMRSNPDMVRKANGAMANMTDEQIRQYADQLEQAASDPTMMKEIERMSKMSTTEREKMQMIQEGLSGAKPMDSKWIDSTIDALKTSPGMFKTMMKGKGAMMGGVTDEQIEGFIDMAASLHPTFLKCTVYLIQWVSSMAKPTMEVYKVADQYTLGLIRYVLIGLLGLVLYFLARFSWWSARTIFGFFYGLVMGSKASSAAAGAGSAAYQYASGGAQSGGVAESIITGAGFAGGAKAAADALAGAGAKTAAAGAAGVAGAGQQKASASPEGHGSGSDKYDF